MIGRHRLDPQITLALDRLRGDVAAIAAAAYDPTDQRAGFLAGRRAVASCFEILGAPATEVGRLPHGAPQWPTGVVGSITRRDGVAVAGISWSRDMQFLGLDIERRSALTPDDGAIVLSSREQAAVRVHAQPADLCTALWSAKEAAYKAWSAHFDGLAGLDPCDIEVVEDGGCEQFTRFSVSGVGPTMVRTAPPLNGRWVLSRDWVISAIAMRRNAAKAPTPAL